MRTSTLLLVSAATLAMAQALPAQIVNYNRDRSDDPSTPEPEEPGTYVFSNLSPGDAAVPSNSTTDLANGVTPVLISGTAHSISGPITNLTDGPGAAGTDSPPTNFFLANGSSGRIGISLPSLSTISQLNSYSWHHGNGTRTPQEYTLYAATGSEPGFVLNTGAADPTAAGYTLLTRVDSEVLAGAADPAQHGVSINPSGASLGDFQHFLFEIPSRLEGTFYSEIDIVGVPVPEPTSLALLGLAGVGLLARRRRV